MKAVLVTAFAVALLADTMSSVSLAVSVVAAVGVGGIIVALLTARKEREQQLRERMLNVADDFLVAAAGAISLLSALLSALDPNAREASVGFVRRIVLGRSAAGPTTTMRGRRDLRDMAEASVDEAHRQLVRVLLIYFPASQAATDAKTVIEHADSACRALHDLHAKWQAADVERRRALAERTGGEIGEEVGAAMRSEVGQALGGSAGEVIGRRIGEAVVRPTKEMKRDLEDARKAITAASEGLEKFSIGASAQALNRRLRYRVNVNEEIEIVVADGWRLNPLRLFR